MSKHDRKDGKHVEGGRVVVGCAKVEMREGGDQIVEKIRVSIRVMLTCSNTKLNRKKYILYFVPTKS